MPSPETCLALKNMLDQVVDGPRVPDRGWLVENLLTELYPDHLSASEIARCLTFDQPDEGLSYFWGVHVVDHTEPSQIPALLDGLCALVGPDAEGEAKALLRNEQFLNVFGHLLAKFLNSKESIPSDKLYRWLDTATANDGPSDDLRPVLVAWLEEHLEAYEEMCRIVDAESMDPKWDRYRLFGGVRPRSAEYAEGREQAPGLEIDLRGSRNSALYEAVTRHQTELSRNQGHHRLLSALADVCESHRSQFRGATPPERLLTSLGRDEALASIVTDALKQTPRRTDLPSAEQVIDSAGTDQRYAITDPYLIGLSLTVTQNDPPVWFDEDEKRRALAFRLCALSGLSGGESPSWYAQLLQKSPELVADVFSKVAMRTFRSKEVDFPRLYELSKDDHKSVARLVLAPLLKKFPTRGVPSEKLYVLINLLQIAFRLESRDDLLKLVEYKLARKSLAAHQRVYWICFGMALDGSAYVERLCQQFEGMGRQRLMPHLVEFLYGFRTSPSRRLHDLMEIDAMKALVQILGPGYRPNWFRDEVSAPRHEVHGSIIVNSLINALAQNPAIEARETLAKLAEDPSLHHLRKRLLFEQENHRRNFPESGFKYLQPEALLGILHDLGAASSADLAVIVVKRIDELINEIRHGDTSDWRQYWNNEGTPLDENSCRDRFLSDLRKLIPDDARADPEAQHADDKRSDIRVFQGGFEVPIEVKKSCARDLWSAVSGQLVPRYARSPRAHGCGILLVFWFGKEGCKRPPTGDTPNTASELRSMLTADLDEELEGKIWVRVVDVSNRP